MGSTSLSLTVNLLFPLGMAIRHGASSSLLPSCSLLFASLLFCLDWLSIAVLFGTGCMPWQQWTHCWYCRIVATRYCSIDTMTATQLLTNTTRFSLPRDIGTPRHWNPESMHRDAPGHWEPRDIGTPSAQGGERAPTREPAKGTDPRNGFLFSGTPLAVTGGLSAARFTAEPLMEVTTSWVVHVGCRYSFWSPFFPETLRGGAVPQHQSELMGREGATWSDAPFVKLHCRTTSSEDGLLVILLWTT